MNQELTIQWNQPCYFIPKGPLNNQQVVDAINDISNKLNQYIANELGNKYGYSFQLYWSALMKVPNVFVLLPMLSVDLETVGSWYKNLPKDRGIIGIRGNTIGFASTNGVKPPPPPPPPPTLSFISEDDSPFHVTLFDEMELSTQVIRSFTAGKDITIVNRLQEE